MTVLIRIINLLRAVWRSLRQWRGNYAKANVTAKPLMHKLLSRFVWVFPSAERKQLWHQALNIMVCGLSDLVMNSGKGVTVEFCTQNFFGPLSTSTPVHLKRVPSCSIISEIYGETITVHISKMQLTPSSWTNKGKIFILVSKHLFRYLDFIFI